MAIRTASVTGDWSASATWGGLAPPGDGDTAVLTAGVTVTVSDARTCAGWTQQGSGVLAVAPAGSGSLTSTGDTTIEGDAVATPKVTVGAGGSLLWAPATGVAITHKTGGDYYRFAEIRARGTASSRCTIGKAVGAAGDLIWRSDVLYLKGTVDAEFADFDGWGTAGADGVDLDLRYNSVFRLHDCRVRDCARWNINARQNDEAGVPVRVSVERTRFTGSLGVESLNVNGSGAEGITSSARIVRCDFDRNATFNAGLPGTLTLTANIFRRQLNGNWPGSNVVSSGHLFFHRHADTSPGMFALPGTHSNCYYFVDFTDDPTSGNPHFWNFAGGDTLVLDRSAFEYRGPYNADEGDVLDLGGGTATVQRCLILPSSTPGHSAGAIWGLGSAINLTLLHNTIYSPGILAGLRLPHNAAMAAGAIGVVKSNVFWTDQPGTNYAIVNDTPETSAVDALSPSGCTANAFVGMSAGTNVVGGSSVTTLVGFNACEFSVAPTGNLTLASGGAQFVDPTRNFLAWSRQVRGKTGTDDAVRDAAIVEIAADPTLVATSLLPWVRSGFDPRAASLATAGHDGATIGAVEHVAAAGPPAGPPARLASWESRVHERHGSGPFPYVVGDGQPAMNASEHYDVLRCLMNARDYCVHRDPDLTPLDWSVEIAAAIVRARDGYYLPGGGEPARHLRYTRGFAEHYRETADPLSLQAVQFQIPPPDRSEDQYTGNWELHGGTREVAYHLQACLDHEWIGLGHHGFTELNAELLLGHVAQWTASPAVRYGVNIKPFFAGLSIKSLIAYWDRYRGDTTPRRAAIVTAIPPAIEGLLAHLWTDCYYEAGPLRPVNGSGESWDHGGIKYSNPYGDHPALATITGLNVVTSGPGYTFTGPSSLSTIDGYYNWMVVEIAVTEPSVQLYVTGYEGATRRFTVRVLYGNTDIPVGQPFSLVANGGMSSDGPPETDLVTPDVTPLVAPAYAWMYWYRKVVLGDAAGAAVHRTRHDAMFDAQTMAWQANTNQKQWNQAMLWATKGLEWRARGDAGEWPAASSFALQAPATGAYGPAGVAGAPLRISIPHGASLSGPVAVTPTSSTGRGTFAPATAVLTTDRPTALFRYTPAALDDGTTVGLSATAVGLTSPAPVAYAVGGAPTALNVLLIASPAGGILLFSRPAA